MCCLIDVTRMLDRTVNDFDEGRPTSMLKSVRQVGIKCLSALFSKCGEFNDWSSYVGLIFDHIIRPRLELFPIETAQSPSGILRLFSTWASSQKIAMFLADGDAHVMRLVADCLAVESQLRTRSCSSSSISFSSLLR